MPDSEFSQSAYAQFANEQLDATRIAVAMCQAVSCRDMGRWLQLLAAIPAPQLVIAMNKVARIAIETLAEALGTPIDKMYEEMVMKLAMAAPDEM